MPWMFALILTVHLLACAGPGGGPDPAPASAPAPVESRQGEKIVNLDGVRVNMTQRFVEIDGTICLREGVLELVATVQAGKEHESIVSVKVRPSAVHAGLLMLGLKPGAPGRWIYHPDRVETVDPTGDRVRIALAYEEKGRWVEKSIRQFVVGRDGKTELPGSEFVFAGSRVVQPPDGGQPVYMADHTGDLIALVSFDTEVLAWPTAASDSNESLFWLANPKTVPELGTPVKLRLYPVKPLE